MLETEHKLRHNQGAKHYLIIGQGAIGSQVTNQLSASLATDKAVQTSVTALARGEKPQYALAEGVVFMQADASKPDGLTAQQVAKFTHIAIIVTPDEHTKAGYHDSYLAIAQNIAGLLSKAGQASQLERIVFISSTGVYGQDEGEWIDETTIPAKPKRIGSQIILQAEQILKQAFDDKLVLIRPSGIYGINRLMQVRKALAVIAQTATNETDTNFDIAQQQPTSTDITWTNRILDTDLAVVIVHVLKLENPKPLYLATDFSPVTSQELTHWLCKRLQDLPDEVIDSLLASQQQQRLKQNNHSLLQLSNEQLSNQQLRNQQLRKQQSYKQQDKNLPVKGKRIKSNLDKAWLSYPSWQMGYEHILTCL